jgi:hypothetical protein
VRRGDQDGVDEPAGDHFAERGETGHARHPGAPRGIDIRHGSELQPRHLAGEHAGSVTVAHVADANDTEADFFHEDARSDPPGRAKTGFLDANPCLLRARR